MLFLRLQDFFFPRQCVVCGRRLAVGEQYVCPVCLLKLPFEEEVDWRMNRHILRWRVEHPALRKCGALCIYRRENAAARLVHEMKFTRDHDLGRWLGRLAAQRLAPSGLFDDVDALVPLPLSRQRRGRRGFNQAESIALGISEELGLPVRTDLLVRHQDRESQTHFRLPDRFRNGRNLFSLAEGAAVAQGQHLMLVDDVMTTGATIMGAVGVLERFPDISISTFTWAWVNLSTEVWIQARRESEA
jgi:ComF family protein